MPDTFQTPQGTFDVLPPDSRAYETLVARFAAAPRPPGYGLIVSPMFEDVGVFQRVGESTDVVRKEMYDFFDKGGRAPRVAARRHRVSVVRAFVQHQPLTPWKIWYVAPFRYERPQNGRYRQHWQVGVEVLGVEDPTVDVEVIALAHGFYRAISGCASCGCSSTRWATPCPGPYREVLVRIGGPTHRSWATRSHGPERIRCASSTRKREAGRRSSRPPPRSATISATPPRRDFERVQAGLRTLGIDFEIAPRLVRGLDYYTGTTFEFQSDALEPRRTPSVAAAVTTASSSRWAARPRRASGSGSASNAR